MGDPPPTIGIVTVGRSDYGIYRPLLRRLAERRDLETTLLVGGMHFDAAFGMTVNEVRGDALAPIIEVPFATDGDNPAAVAATMGRGVEAFGAAYVDRSFDLLIVLGDRCEMLAAAAAAVPFNLPLLHIHGGEMTLGAMDDAFRHAITKFSHLHAVATETYRRRVLQLGEREDRVFTVGALSLDDVETVSELSREVLEQRFGIDLSSPPILVTFHPATRESRAATAQQEELLAALDGIGAPVIFTSPNADQGGRGLLAQLHRWLAGRPHWRLVESFGKQAYFSILRHASMMVGNSSSGLIEAPSFGLPVVNIGERQSGRIRGANVVDVPCERAAIGEALVKADAPDFRAAARVAGNPYWHGGATDRLLEILARLPARAVLLAKGFVDRPVTETQN